MAKARYARFSFKASAILKTGGGVHCYWILKEPLLSDGTEIVRDANRRIAHALGGDKACCEPARNLRVSDRLNHKYKPAYKVNVSSFDPDTKLRISWTCPRPPLPFTPL